MHRDQFLQAQYYVVRTYSFWGHGNDPAGALPLDPAGGLPSPRPLLSHYTPLTLHSR